MTWEDYIGTAALGEPIIEWKSNNSDWLNAIELPYFIAWTEHYVMDAQLIYDEAHDEYLDCLGILARSPDHNVPSQIVCIGPDTGELEYHPDVLTNTAPNKDTQ